MFTNIFKVAIRNLFKNFGYTIINVLGLAIGLACSILIFLYVSNELSYDSFHEKSDRTYRVWITGNMPGTEMRDVRTAAPMASALLSDYPEVEHVTRLGQFRGWIVRSGERIFHETEREFIFADSSFFDVFDFKLLRGNPSTCLRDPRSVILSERYARKYFGNEDPMGKNLRIERDTNFWTVTGIIENAPSNSHIPYEMIGAMSYVGLSRSENWVNNNVLTYFTLSEGTDPDAFEDRLYEMVIKYVGPLVESFMGINLEQFEEAGHSYGYRIQKITDIHLRSDLNGEMKEGGNVQYVYIFLVVAILILIIACINFMNLATARSSTRAREVGIRKVVGSTRSMLIAQFNTESVFLTLISMFFAVIMVYLLLPGYNNLIRMDLVFDVFSSGLIIPLLVLFAVFVGLLSGIYPALVLASFKPVSVFKAKIQTGSRKNMLRSLLIVMQFTVSIVILLGTITVNRQLNYMQKKDPGFGKEKVLVLHRSDALQGRIESFKQEIIQNANILSVANSTQIPSSNYWNNAHWLEGWDRSDIITIWTSYTSYDYHKALDLEIIQGRFFDRSMPSDSFGVVVNEATLKSLGIEDPLSTRFEDPDDDGGVYRYYPIIGVVKDFHFRSMHEEIQPLAIHFMRGNYEGVIVIKLGEGNVAATVDFVQRTWEEFNSGYPFEYTWLDDEFGKLFETERKTTSILLIFSILSIFISCLGLLGLISYSTNQRTKEIGIRKTMGASVNIVMLLLSKETIRLLAIATLISVPAYFGVKAWLQNFAYTIPFNPAVYAALLILVAVFVLIVSLLTVSYMSYRAAIANPAQSLRVE